MHGLLKSLACSLILLTIFLHSAASSPGLVPVRPDVGQVFNDTNDVTFTCNASDGGQILNMSLYHNLNGTFSKNQTEYYETSQDGSTTFLCRFDGSSICYGLGNGAPYVSDSVSFGPGNFSQGIIINDTSVLRYTSQGNFDRSRGTVEFWISPGDISGQVGYIFQAADNDADNVNQMQIRYNSGTLKFEINDISYASFFDYGDISSWQPGEWHHVAAIWDLSGDIGDGNPVSLYIDGAPQENYQCDDPSYQCNIPIRYYYTSSTFSIGSDKHNVTQANATMDDFRISNAVRSASEINETYNKGLANYSSVSKSWTFENVPDGSYAWKCTAYDNDSEENASSIRSFYVDVSTQPSVNAIYLSPNSSDDIDPGVTINFTANISDPSGVDTVIFQWKEAEEGGWNNATMAYNASAGLYGNAAFQTMPNDMSVYYYRIWSNDSGGRSGYSTTRNVTSAVDFTWTGSPASFGTVSGLIGSRSNVGTLAINNTGDRTLNFTISDNWPLYYNGSENANFYVTNHTAITLNVTADFASSDGENDIVIIINASHYSNPPSLSPVSLAVNATINSYSGGPYLVVSITEYASMVSQSQTFNLSARVKNIGNETAGDVWLNWTLPDGWESASGNISQFIGNLSSGSAVLSNLSILIDPASASPGTFTISANSGCSENSSGYDSKTVGVECSNSDGVCGHGCSYVNDIDCGIPTGSPGAGVPSILVGGGQEAIGYSMKISAASMIDVTRGGAGKATAVRISNDAKRTNLSGITLSVTGWPLTQVKIVPASISVIEYGKSSQFELEFTAPAYMKYGVYNITITARASGSSAGIKNATSVEKSVRISVSVHSSQENQTLSMAQEAESALEQMNASGMATGAISSLLEKARAQISGWDYDSAMDTLQSAIQIKERAFNISAEISQAERSMAEAEALGIQIPETRKMVELSKSALSREDYAKAEERAGNALVSYVIESRGIETVRFVYAYWWEIIMLSAFSAGAVYVAHRRARKRVLRKRIERLSLQEGALNSIMEKSKADYFKSRSISSHEYHTTMAESESRLAKIRKEKSEASSRLARLRGGESIKREQESLKSELADLQKSYYEKGAISKSSYSKTAVQLREQLAESIANADAIMERRSGKKATKIASAAIIFLFLLSSSAFGQADGKAADAIKSAEGWISEMKELGFPVSRANDTLNQARLLYSKGFYAGAESLANDVLSLKDKAIELAKKADQTEAYIYDVSRSADASQAKAIFEQALASLKSEQYESAEQLLNSAYGTAEQAESDSAMKRVTESGWNSALAAIRDNMALIAISAAGLCVLVIVSIKAARSRRKHAEIRKLRQEQESLKARVKSAQERYFTKGEIGKEEYDSLMKSYTKSMSTASRKLLVLERGKNSAEKSPQKEKAAAGKKAEQKTEGAKAPSSR